MNVYLKVFYSPDERKDIINFYNDIYIRHMKEYIISMKLGAQPLTALSMNNSYLQGGSQTPVITRSQAPLTPQIRKPSIKELYPQVRLEEALPKG
jgi:hypothetical protein